MNDITNAEGQHSLTICRSCRCAFRHAFVHSFECGWRVCLCFHDCSPLRVRPLACICFVCIVYGWCCGVCMLYVLYKCLAFAIQSIVKLARTRTFSQGTHVYGRIRTSSRLDPAAFIWLCSSMTSTHWQIYVYYYRLLWARLFSVLNLFFFRLPARSNYVTTCVCMRWEFYADVRTYYM